MYFQKTYNRIRNKIVLHYLNKWIKDPYKHCPHYDTCQVEFDENSDPEYDDSIRQAGMDAHD